MTVTESLPNAESVPTQRNISKPKIILILLLPFVFPVFIYFLSTWLLKKLPNDIAVPYGANITMFAKREDDPERFNGAKLYQQHCSNCHGINGDGKGITALSVRARHFGGEKYKFTSDYHPDDGKPAVPNDDDFHKIIVHGIPGTPMPAFDEKILSYDQRVAVINHVRELTHHGLTRNAKELTRLKLKNENGGKEPSEEDIEDYLPGVVNNMLPYLSPGSKIPTPSPSEFTLKPNSLENGLKVYTTNCASCHGPKGEGDGPNTKEPVDPKFRNEDGTVPKPRNLTLGLYKGGASHQELYQRVFIGIPGTNMTKLGAANGQTSIPQQDIIDLIHYIKSLSTAK